MAYTKRNFADGNVLHAADLNAMDDQIAANENVAGAVAAVAAAAAAAAEGAVQKKTDEGSHVYGHNGDHETEYPVDVSPNASTIPYRTTGGRVKVGTPTEDNDATTKKYVDDALAEVGGSSDIAHETWTLGMADGTEITKEVCVWAGA